MHLVIDFMDEFSSVCFLVSSGRNFKIYGVSELCPYGDEEKTLSSSKPAFSVTSAKTMKDGHKKFVVSVISLCEIQCSVRCI